MPTVNRDTVEEFWDADVLAHCYDSALQVDTTDFLVHLGTFLGTSGKMWATQSARFALQQFISDVVSSEKRSVLLCSFNCQVVADAVINAGFKVETFDLADVTGRIDWGKMAKQLKPHHGALVVPHLFGVPTDFRPICETAEKLGIWIIEDCAPTLGGKIGDSMAGTIGDAAIFSFNYDKPISLGGGGVLLVNNPELWPKIRLTQQAVDLESEAQELNLFVTYLQKRRKSIRQSKMALPIRIFKGIKRRLWPSKAKKLFPVSGIGPLRAALGMWQLDKYPEIVSQRNKNATLLAHEAKCQSWFVSPAVTPAWLKQKVIPLKKAKHISQYLQSQGLRVGLFNWSITLDKYLGLPENPNAHYIAKNSLDIPIHQNMTPTELEMIGRIVCGEVIK